MTVLIKSMIAVMRRTIARCFSSLFCAFSAYSLVLTFSLFGI
nr:MAG TPA: hypothetical protein [Caudoviricetes sp.]